MAESRGRPQLATGEWIVLRDGASEPSYLRHLLVSNEFERRWRHLRGRRGRAGAGEVPAIAFTLPDRDLQRHAVRVLDQADALRAKRTRVVERHRALAHALFVERFGVAPEAVFPALPIAALLKELPRQGVDVPLDAQGRFPVLRWSDLRDGGIDIAGAKRVSHADADLARTALEDGDLVVGRDPSGADLRCAIARPGESVWFTHARVWRLRPDTAQVLPEYLQGWLSSPEGQRRVRSAWRSGGPGITVDQRLAGVPLPVPPMDQQRVYAGRIGAAERLEGRFMASAAKLDALLGTLRDLAFRGELTAMLSLGR